MNKLDGCLNFVGQRFESAIRIAKILPQHKYFTIPIYKFCVDKIGTVAATGVSFLAADLVVHQLIPKIIACSVSQIITNKKLEDSCNLSYNYAQTLYWAAIAIPVMYAKYKRNCNYSRPYLLRI